MSKIKLEPQGGKIKVEPQTNSINNSSTDHPDDKTNVLHMAGNLGAIQFKEHFISSDFYQALDLQSKQDISSQAELRQKYLQKATLFHPDKHPPELKEQAAIAFSRISLAFRTLSDPTLKQKYDKEGSFSHVSQTKSSLESGDKVFNALEEAKAYGEVLPLIRELPKIESAHDLPSGSLRAVAGHLGKCTGVDCDVSFLAYPHLAPRRVLLCRTHLTLHQCDHRCTHPNRICVLWAAWHINKYRHEVQSSWVLEDSEKDDPHTPNGKYWFNQRAGISRWCDKDSDKPPTEHATPHNCTMAKCQPAGYICLDPGIFVCRASGTGHMCTATQCHMHWRKPITKKSYKKKVIEIDESEQGELVCWATGRPIHAKIEEESRWDSSISVADRPREQDIGLEQRVITYKDVRTGMTVQQMVERPLGSTIGEAVENAQRSSMRDSVIQETQAQALERQKERNRLAKRRHQRQDDFGVDEMDREQLRQDEEKAKQGEKDLRRKRKRRVSAEFVEKKKRGTVSVSEMKDIVKTSMQRLRDCDWSGSEGSDDEIQEEEQGTYNAYNVLDEGDYNREEIGDYNTQYTLAGGVEAIQEEEEELHEHEYSARRDYLEYAERQFIKESDPNRPVEWFGNPSIGYEHPDNRAMRVFDGKTYRILQKPPMFKVPKFTGMERNQIHRRFPQPRAKSMSAGMPRSRKGLKSMAHKLAPRGSTSPNAMSRSSSPTPSVSSMTSGADRMDFDVDVDVDVDTNVDVDVDVGGAGTSTSNTNIASSSVTSVFTPRNVLVTLKPCKTANTKSNNKSKPTLSSLLAASKKDAQRKKDDDKKGGGKGKKK